MFILLGIFVAVYITDKRWKARGGGEGQIADVALWAVPAGIVGARVYHVMTDWTTYFGADGAGFVAALKIWQGGLGIWGGVAGARSAPGTRTRRYGLLLPPLGTRWHRAWPSRRRSAVWATGSTRSCSENRQRCRGRCRSTPRTARRATSSSRRFTRRSCTRPRGAWVSLRSSGGWTGAIGWATGECSRRMWLCTLGRLWWELLRIDSATLIFGVRINVFTSVLVGLGAVLYIVISRRRVPGREESVYRGLRSLSTRGTDEYVDLYLDSPPCAAVFNCAWAAANSLRT